MHRYGNEAMQQVCSNISNISTVAFFHMLEMRCTHTAVLQIGGRMHTRERTRAPHTYNSDNGCSSSVCIEKELTVQGQTDILRTLVQRGGLAACWSIWT